MRDQGASTKLSERILLAVDISDLTTIDNLASAAAVLAKGPKALASWLNKRTEERYGEFIAAAKEGHVFPENAEAMTADDLFAILRSLELDMEAEKAALYGRLAGSIAKGAVAKDHKRHFIKALRELSYAQVQRLRCAWVASRYQLRPAVGAGRINARDFLAGGTIGRIDEAALRQFALADAEKLTDAGIRFVEACFLGSELKPFSIGELQWATGVIQVICNEMGDAACSQFISKLTADGQARAIKVTNSAAIRGHSPHFRLLSGSLIVLLFRDSQKLAREWDVVESMTGKDATFISATFGTGELLPAPFTKFEQLDVSADGGRVASDSIIALFDRLGYGGDTDR